MANIVDFGKENNLFNSSDYPNILKLKSTPAINSLTEILSVSGAGYINSALVGLYASSVGTYYLEIEIVADGVTLIDTERTLALAGNMGTGFINSEALEIFSTSTSTVNIFIDGIKAPSGNSGFGGISTAVSNGTDNLISTLSPIFPFTTGGGILVLDHPIIFNNSLVIRARSTADPCVIITGGTK